MNDILPWHAGQINHLNLGTAAAVRDDLTKQPFFSPKLSSPPMNLLFAALYYLVFSRLTRMGYLVPDSTRTIQDIFDEKVYGTDMYLVSKETIAYLKGLIYLSLYPSKGDIAHSEFYEDELEILRHPENSCWRLALCKEASRVVQNSRASWEKAGAAKRFRSSYRAWRGRNHELGRGGP